MGLCSLAAANEAINTRYLWIIRSSQVTQGAIEEFECEL